MKLYPLIAATLLKTKPSKPKGMQAMRLVMGGLDQAYSYRQDHGKYWEQTPGAIEFLKQCQPPKTKKRR
jgi:hypothetical protein